MKRKNFSGLFAASKVFRFDDATEEEDEAKEIEIAIDVARKLRNLDDRVYLLARIGVCRNDLESKQVEFKKGECVWIQWEESSHFSWSVCKVSDLFGEVSLDSDFVPVWSKEILLLCLAEEFEEKKRGFCVEEIDFADVRHEMGGIAPFHIEPGLSSLVYPFSIDHFFQKFMMSSDGIFACHSSGERLSLLKSNDLDHFNVENMLKKSSKIIVWMKDKESKNEKMQYIELGDPAIALSCYKAGHLLYFNPDIEVQRQYLDSIAEDLGIPVTQAVHSKSYDYLNGIGDMEVFAVTGPHKTSWHFDAQENFTIQLQGTKVWYICPGQEYPISNLHPSSSNLDGLFNDFRVHNTYSDNAANLTPPKDDNPKIKKIIMRPGSVLFIPSGFWHKVEAQEKSGSLSMNFSIDGPRWCDFIFSKIIPLIWRNINMRRRVYLKPGLPFKEIENEYIAKLLQELTKEIAILKPDHFIPKGIVSRDCLSRLLGDAISDADHLRISISDVSRDELISLECKLIEEGINIKVRDAKEDTKNLIAYHIYSGYSSSSSSGASIIPEFECSLNIRTEYEPIIAKFISCNSSNITLANEELKDINFETVQYLIYALVLLGFFVL